MNLIDLAVATYTEALAHRDDELAEHQRENEEQFLKNARACATGVLGGTEEQTSRADQLPWRYVSASELPQDVEEARADLAPDRPEYLRYRVDHAKETITFDLVQPCGACGHDRVSQVSGLYHLGQLLTEGGER